MRARTTLVMLTAFALAGCGGEGASDTSAATSAEAPQQGAAQPEAGAVEIGPAELEAYERGITGEIEAVRAAQQAYDTASTPGSRGALQQAQWETATIAQGARAAGLDESRYAAIRRTVHETLRTLDFQGKIPGPLSIDTTRADEATRARLRQDAYASLPPATAAAMRAREARLAALWGDYMRLVAVAG